MSAHEPSSNPTLLLGLGGLALLSGCPSDDDDCDDEIAGVSRPPAPELVEGPPMIGEALWLDERVLELRFTEPLEPLGSGPDALDPLRFRVLRADITANSYYDGDCALYTSYRVPSQGYQAIYADTVWQAPDDESVLRLRMNMPLRCTTGPGAGLMLVYTNDPIPALSGTGIVRDAEGTPMADLGPAWAITGLATCADRYSDAYGYYSYPCSSLSQFYGGGFPLLTSLLPIPCPT